MTEPITRCVPADVQRSNRARPPGRREMFQPIELSCRDTAATPPLAEKQCQAIGFS